MEEIKKNIYQKMLEIEKKVDAIPKNGWNDYSKYSYVQAVDVVGYIRKLLIEQRIKLEISEKKTTRIKDGKNFHTILESEAAFVNVDEPTDRIVVSFSGVGADTLDKDIYKAKTGGLKYLLIQEFLIPSDDFVDPEKNNNAEKQTNQPDTKKTVEPPKRKTEAQQQSSSSVEKKMMCGIIIEYENKVARDRLKKDGFKWDSANKMWTMLITENEYNGYSAEFEVTIL